jgi:hypothetical protein
MRCEENRLSDKPPFNDRHVKSLAASNKILAIPYDNRKKMSNSMVPRNP